MFGIVIEVFDILLVDIILIFVYMQKEFQDNLYEGMMKIIQDINVVNVNSIGIDFFNVVVIILVIGMSNENCNKMLSIMNNGFVVIILVVFMNGGGILFVFSFGGVFLFVVSLQIIVGLLFFFIFVLMFIFLLL